MKNFGSVFYGLLIAAFLSLPLFLMQGCSDATSPPATGDNVSLSMFGTTAYSDLADSLKLDTVKVLIKDIKLNVQNTGDSTNFKVGPFSYFLNLDGSVNTMTTAQIPAGSYDKVKFEIHKLEPGETPPDPEFLDSAGRYSTVVKGFFNGVYFVFKSDVSVHQKLNFPTVIPVAADAQNNITLTAEPYKWFRDNGNWLDPNVPSNRNLIEKNIRDNVNNNFRAFKDNDKNGIPD